jgi:hypothetical protein
MWSEVRKVGLLALAMLLCGGCTAQHRISPGESMKSIGAADRLPCVGNFSVEGGYWTGHVVKSFGEYPNSSKSETFAYLLAKISSVGYLIDSYNKETGLIRASYPLTFGKGDTTALNAAVSDGHTGIRVALTFMTGGMATFSIDEVQKEFCSILEGVPKKEVIEPVKAQVQEEPIIREKPVVVENPGSPAVPTPQPQVLRSLVVNKKANLRAEANIKSRLLGTLKEGENLEILGRSGDWFRVKSASGLTGWIFKTLVRTVD